jgi:hypothetical protein
MSSRLDYYFRQRVSEAELDLGFELLEQADRALTSDIGLVGVVSGGVPTPHQPVADLTIDLTGPARAYDKLGQRIFMATGSRVDLARDADGVPTAVTAAGEERWLGVFLAFDRLLSDPRLDGNSREVFFRRDEAYRLFVRQGEAAPAGRAVRVALEDDALLLCDVHLVEGQTQIPNASIDTSRRQAFVFAKGSLVGVEPGAWTALRPAAPTVQAAFDATDQLISRHTLGQALRHTGAHIDYVPKAFLREKTLGGALDELVAALVANTGATRIGMAGVAGSPNELTDGTVRTAIEQLLLALNEHQVSGEAHPAAAILANPNTLLRTTNVQAQLEEIIQALAASTGWDLIGTSGAGGVPTSLPGGPLSGVVRGIVDALNRHVGSSDHDSRYPRRIFSESAILARGEKREVGLLSQTPTFVTTAHSEVDANNRPVGPLYYHGPYSLAISVNVRKDNSGTHLWIENANSVRLFFGINAFAF